MQITHKFNALRKVTLDIWAILVLTSIGLLFYHSFNKNKDVERQLHSYEKINYYIFITVYYILTVAFVLNLRHLVKIIWI
jgi:hypothetical protein